MAIQRFDAQLEAVLLLPDKAGITEVGWQRIEERAERSLGIWKGGEGMLDNDAAEEAEGARKEREL